MEVVSLMSSCIPFVSTNAAAGDTLKSPPPVVEEDQAEKLPFSKPSTNIMSDTDAVGDGV